MNVLNDYFYRPARCWVKQFSLEFSETHESRILNLVDDTQKQKSPSRLRDTNTKKATWLVIILIENSSSKAREGQKAGNALAPRAAQEHHAYLSNFIASFFPLLCLRKWQMPAQGSLLRKIITSLLIFPGSRGWGRVVFLFNFSKPSREILLKLNILSKRKERGKKIQTRHIYQEDSFENLNDIISMQTKK